MKFNWYVIGMILLVGNHGYTMGPRVLGALRNMAPELRIAFEEGFGRAKEAGSKFLRTEPAHDVPTSIYQRVSPDVEAAVKEGATRAREAGSRYFSAYPGEKVPTSIYERVAPDVEAAAKEGLGRAKETIKEGARRAKEAGAKFFSTEPAHNVPTSIYQRVSPDVGAAVKEGLGRAKETVKEGATRAREAGSRYFSAYPGEKIPTSIYERVAPELYEALRMMGRQVRSSNGKIWDKLKKELTSFKLAHRPVRFGLKSVEKMTAKEVLEARSSDLFNPNMSATEAKKRYHMLMQKFHPDRAGSPKDRVLFNKVSQKINLDYSSLKNTFRKN